MYLLINYGSLVVIIENIMILGDTYIFAISVSCKHITSFLFIDHQFSQIIQ